MNKRPSWHKYFMDIVRLVSTRSTCLSRQVGCVAVKDKRIIATGYNGNISGAKHCTECLRKNQSGKNLDRCRAVHAEGNIISQAAQHGISLKGATIYLELQPCNMCFKMLANCFVKEIIYINSYPDMVIDEIMKDAGWYTITFYDKEDNNQMYRKITNDRNNNFEQFYKHFEKAGSWDD